MNSHLTPRSTAGMNMFKYPVDEPVYLNGYNLYTDVNGYSKSVEKGPSRPMHNALTAYCGHFSEEKKAPNPKVPVKPARFRFRCPRCGRQYSRAYTVKQHFPGCVRRYGNPLAKRWYDSIPSKHKYHTRRPNGQRRTGAPETLHGQTPVLGNPEQVASEAYQSFIQYTDLDGVENTVSEAHEGPIQYMDMVEMEFDDFEVDQASVQFEDMDIMPSIEGTDLDNANVTTSNAESDWVPYPSNFGHDGEMLDPRLWLE